MSRVIHASLAALNQRGEVICVPAIFLADNETDDEIGTTVKQYAEWYFSATWYSKITCSWSFEWEVLKLDKCD